METRSNGVGGLPGAYAPFRGSRGRPPLVVTPSLTGTFISPRLPLSRQFGGPQRRQLGAELSPQNAGEFFRLGRPALFRVSRVFLNPAPGKLGVASGDDLRERFVVIDRATPENGRPPNARTFARSVFDLGTDDTEAVALERRPKLGLRHLRRWCLQPHFDPSVGPRSKFSAQKRSVIDAPEAELSQRR
jgi:hypothetical protein